MAGAPDDWVGAAELGDYTFCPRAHWYARTQEGGGVDDPRSASGRAFHTRSLTRIARGQRRGGAYAALAIAALLLSLAAAAIVLGVR